MEAKNEFLVIIPDNVGMLSKRIEIREKHKENIKPLVEAGVISLGGPTLASHPAEGEAPNINGSGLLMRGSSIKEIRAILEKDAYATNGVWDLTKAQILPVSAKTPVIRKLSVSLFPEMRQAL